MCLGGGVSYKKKYEIFFASLMKKGVGSGSVKAGSLKMNTALEYSTRVVQEGGRRCKKSTLNDLVHLTPLRIPLMNPPLVRGMDPRIRIRTKMSRIPNTDRNLMSMIRRRVSLSPELNDIDDILLLLLEAKK
jgi:hypothetical protein